MGYEPLPGTIVDVDMIGSGRLPNDPMLLSARAAIRTLLAATLAQQGIDVAGLPRQDLGDGLRLVVPAVVSPAALVDPFVHNLDIALRQHRERSSTVARLRLRVAIHHGLVHADGVLAGESLRVVARLLDAAPVRRAAQVAQEANLVLVVSQTMYDWVVRHGYGLDPALFQQIAIEEKETSTVAWLYVPGFTPGLTLDRPTDPPTESPAEPPAEPPAVPRPSAPSPATHTEVRAGRDVIHIQGDHNEVSTGDS